MAAKVQKTGEEKQIKKHSKSSLIVSEKYKNRKDLLSVVLADNKLYGFEEVDKMVDDFMKGKVK